MRDTWMWTMKRCLLPLLLIFTLCSGTVASCSQSHPPSTTLAGDRPSWNEKQVIDYLYKYLTNKAERYEDLLISMKFEKAVTQANQESLKHDDLMGATVEMKFEELPSGITILTWANALKYLVKYSGNSWWSVTIDDQEWRVNETRNEVVVVAWNEEASKQLERISTNTYHNSVYGYYIDYPSSWTMDDNGASAVIMYKGVSDYISSYVFVGVTDEKSIAAYKSLQELIQTETLLLRNKNYQFEVVKTTSTEIDYTYMASKGAAKYEVKHYFVQNGGMLYEIICSAKLPEVTILNEVFGANIYDAYYSFRFLP